MHLAAAVLAAPFVRQLDLGAAAKSSFRGKSEKRSVQHRLAGNDSFKRLNSVVEYANPLGPKSKERIFDSADIGGVFNLL